MSRRAPKPAGRDRRRLTATEIDLSVVQQRALLVGTGFGARSVEDAEDSLVELALLCSTAASGLPPLPRGARDASNAARDRRCPLAHYARARPRVGLCARGSEA